MLNFHSMYHPITSRPFLSDTSYREYTPCMFLRPYISCYWTAEGEENGKRSEVLVIPDTCMDIIIHVNHTKQVISGYLSGIQDGPFISVQGQSTDRITTFGIRFPFWAAHLFLKLDFNEICNRNIELVDLESSWNKLYEPFLYLTGNTARVERAERFLMEKMEEIQQNSILFNSFQQIISKNGRESIKNVCEYCCVSPRQMERHFLRHVGLPLKRISNIVRYQNVWRDMVLSHPFDIQDAVYRYGYTDQSHLLKEFRRFHGISPEEAKKIALISR